MDRESTFLVVKCPKGTCDKAVCGVCGDAFAKSTPNATHNCPAEVIYSIHTVLLSLGEINQASTGTKRARQTKAKTPRKGTGATQWSKGTGYGGGSESLNTAVVEKAQERERDMDLRMAGVFASLEAEFTRFSQHPLLVAPDVAPFQRTIACMALQSLLNRSCLESVIYKVS
jgi:hypothetical protein